MGTNPVAVAIPAGRYGTFLLDIALSTVAKGKIRLAEAKGEEIPDTWALDPDGNKTRDPARAMAGALLYMGGHKGYGMALVVDILAAALSGAAFSPDIESVFKFGRVSDIGHFFIAVDVAAFGSRTDIESRIEDYLQVVKESPRMEGIDAILIPGEPEQAREAEAARHGIPVSEELLTEIQGCFE